MIPFVYPSKKILLQTSQVRLDRYVLDSDGGNPPKASCYADVFNTTYSLNNRFTEKPNNFTVFRSHKIGYFRLYLSSGSPRQEIQERGGNFFRRKSLKAQRKVSICTDSYTCRIAKLKLPAINLTLTLTPPIWKKHFLSF